MKDARRGLHSLVEDTLPEGRLLEFIEHSPAQVLNLFPSTQLSSESLRNMTGPCDLPAPVALRARHRGLPVQPEVIFALQYRPGQPRILRHHCHHRLPVAAPAFDILCPTADRVVLLPATL